MCGRFAPQNIPKPLFAEFVIIPPPVQPRYNIAPTQMAPVVLIGPDCKPVIENFIIFGPGWRRLWCVPRHH